jgi:hypothetical protein
MSSNQHDLQRISKNAKAEAASRSFAAAKIHASRPVATLNSYIPLQKDYIGKAFNFIQTSMSLNYYRLDWCQKAYQNDIVIEDRLLRFLKEVVLVEDANGRLHGRPCQKRGPKASSLEGPKKKKATGCSDISNEVQFIQVAQVKQYVSAIVDLWKYQKDVVIINFLTLFHSLLTLFQRKDNSYENPHTSLVKGLLHNFTLEVSKLKNETFKDRAASIVAQNLTMEEFKKLARYFWTSNLTKKSLEYGMLHQADFLVSGALFCRGQIMRKAVLSRLFFQPLPNEGLHDILSNSHSFYALGINGTFAISFGHNEGKINHLGKELITSLMRNSDVEICGIGALSRYFFIRFDIAGECFSMQNKKDWYNIHVFSGSKNGSQISTEKQYTAINNAKKVCFL